jgi:UDP-glucose 4-epimerase
MLNEGKTKPKNQAIITGASGFLGRALALYLLEHGAEVIAISRHPIDLPCATQISDVTEAGVLDQLLSERSVVFHMAATANVGASLHNPRDDFANNVAATFEVLESVRKAGCRMVFPSTASVFDTSNELPLSEAARVKPTSPYAAGKVAGEAYCAAYHRSYSLDIRIARVFSVYGPGMNRLAIHDFVRKIQRNPQRLEIFGDGEQIRDYLYIDDAVRGLALIAERGEAGQYYNLASGIPVRLLDLARKIAALMKHPAIEILPTGKPTPGDLPKWYADIEKIQRIGFSPLVGLDEGLLRTIRHLTGGSIPAGVIG